MSSTREIDDDYNNEVCRHGKARVIVCKDGIQWIVQTQSPKLQHWYSQSYCASKKALIRTYLEVGGVECPELAELPKMIKRRPQPKRKH